jgi:hypothetical protein
VSGKRKSADHPRPQHPLFWPGDSDAMRLTGPVVRSSTDADFVVSHRTRGPRRSGSYQAVLSSRREASCGSSRSAKPNRFSCFIGGLTQSSCTFPACSKRTQTNRRSHPRPPPGSPPVCQWGLRKPETLYGDPNYPNETATFLPVNDNELLIVGIRYHTANAFSLDSKGILVLTQTSPGKAAESFRWKCER